MMKIKSYLSVIVLTLLNTEVYGFDVRFADASWDGIKVPAGQQCLRFGGINPATPRLIVGDIPTGTTAIELEYSDRDYQKMDNGGHGKMSFVLGSSITKVEIPSVPGHSFNLPVGFKTIAAHLSPGWDKAGAYMPPCSGGKKHAYYVTVKAVNGNRVTAEAVLEMGDY